MERLISTGAYSTGQRLPSIRGLSRQLSVSITTVLGAYRLLEQRRLIEPRQRSGYYVRFITGARPAPAKTVTSARAQHLDFGAHVLHEHEPPTGPDFVSLDTAVPSPEFLPIRRLNQLLVRAVRDNAHGGQTYDAAAGLPALCTQIARRMIDAGCSVAPSDIVITAGASQAVHLCLSALTRPGDTVVVETPTYFGFLTVLEALHLRVIEVATCPRDGICLDSLKKVLGRQRVAACLLVPNFGNPLGHCMPNDRKEGLVRLLARHNVPLIEDDINGELAYSGGRPLAVKSYDRDGTILYCSSFSKTVAPGYRVGWTIPGRFAEQVQRLKFGICVANPTCTQMAMEAFLETGAYDRHLRRLRRTYADLMARTRRLISETFPEGTRLTSPTGGHILWVELPQGVDALILRKRAWKAGVGVAPGAAFSPTRRYTNFIRLNCAVSWSTRFESALRTLAGLVHEAMPGSGVRSQH